MTGAAASEAAEYGAFGIDLSFETDMCLLEARGEIGLCTAPELRAALDAAASGASGPVLVDLCDVTFIDSTGLTVLLRADANLRAQGRRLAVARIDHGAVARRFELNDVTTLLDVHPTRASGLGRLRDGPG